MPEEIVNVAVKIGHDPDQRARAKTDREGHKQPAKEIAKENPHECERSYM
jgi:hypothetical protein